MDEAERLRQYKAIRQLTQSRAFPALVTLINDEISRHRDSWLEPAAEVRPPERGEILAAVGALRDLLAAIYARSEMASAAEDEAEEQRRELVAGRQSRGDLAT